MNYEIDCKHWLDVTDMRDVTEFASSPMAGEVGTQYRALIFAGEKTWTEADRTFVTETKKKANEYRDFWNAKALAEYEAEQAKKSAAFVTDDQKAVLDKMMGNGASLRALAEQQAQFYRENGFEIYA